jgi:hypothetical protein
MNRRAAVYGEPVRGSEFRNQQGIYREFSRIKPFLAAAENRPFVGVLRRNSLLVGAGNRIGG